MYEHNIYLPILILEDETIKDPADTGPSMQNTQDWGSSVFYLRKPPALTGF